MKIFNKLFGKDNTMNFAGGIYTDGDLIGGNIIEGIKGNGVVIKKDYTSAITGAIRTLRVTGTVDVEMQVDDKFTTDFLELEIEENLVDMIKIEMKGDMLNIYSYGSFSSSTSITVRLNTKTLSKLKKIGTGDVTGTYYGDKLTIDKSGTGDVTLIGETKSVEIDKSGTGDLDIRGLISDTLEIEAAGTGDIEAFASLSVQANISGICTVRVHGKPQSTQINCSGLGKFKTA